MARMLLLACVLLLSNPSFAGQTGSGACCLPDGSCVQTSAGDCALAGGTYLGDGSDCAPDAVGDGGFELGVSGGVWTAFSTLNGTPICSIGVCGFAGTGPRSGDFWCRIGGSGVGETATLEQAVTIPPNATSLSFYLEIPMASGNGGDFLRVRMDGTEIFFITESDGPYRGYLPVEIDISSYADGGSHLLRFESGTGGDTNFSLDDISIRTGPSFCPARRYLVAQNAPIRAVHLVDTNAGALFDYEYIDVTATAMPPPANLWDAELVGDEIWTSSSQDIYRYDAQTLTFLSSIALGAGAPAVGMEVVGDSVWVTAGVNLLEFSTDGTLLATHPVTGSYDVMEWNGELLVSNRNTDTVDRYDFSGQLLGVFAGPGPFFDPNNPMSGAIAFLPGQIARRAVGGNLLIVGVTRVFEFTPTGAVVGSYQAGPFEQGAQEMADGRILVMNSSGAAIYDPSDPIDLPPPIPATTPRQMRFMSPFDPGDGSSARYCLPAPNSVGAGARLSAVGTASISTPVFALHLRNAPPSQASLLVYGDTPAQQPFGDGFLCVDPSGVLIRLNLAFIAPNGMLQTIIDFGSLPPAGTIAAGSTWYFQQLFRDGAFGGVGFNGSDGVRVTFQL